MGIFHHEAEHVRAEQVFDELLELGRRREDLVERQHDAIDVVAMVERPREHGARVVKCAVDFLERLCLRTHRINVLAAYVERFLRILDEPDALVDVGLCRLGVFLQLRQLTFELAKMRTALPERRLRGVERALDLLGAASEQVVLDISSRERLAGPHRLERALVDALLVRAHVRRKLRDLAICLLALLAHAFRISLVLVELRLQLLHLRDRVPALGLVTIEELGRLGLARLGSVDGLAQLGQARDHVAPLLLEQQHARVKTLEHHLAAAALLGEVSDEQPLLLEQAL